MKKISCLLCVFTLLLGGCSQEEETTSNNVVVDPITDDGYRIVIPFEESDATQTHVTFNRSDYDTTAVGEGLMRYSQDYFSTSKYYLQDGQLLDRDTLHTNTYYGDSIGLLGFKSDTNTYGLNPEQGSELPVEDGETCIVGSSTIPIIDIVEYNFHTDSSGESDIEGISLAIVLNRTITDADGVSHTISDDNLQIIGEEAARNVVSYLKTLAKVSNQTPIMVALFVAESSDTNLAGTYFSVGYGVSGIDQFIDVTEQRVLFPSTTASSLDSAVSTQFNSLKTALFSFLPNDISMVGKGFYIDNELYELDITITTQAKTYSENLALVQYVDSLLYYFSDNYYSITISFTSNTEQFAVLKRDIGNYETTIIMQ